MNWWTKVRRRLSTAFLVASYVALGGAVVGATFTALCGTGTACAYISGDRFGYRTVELIRTNLNDLDTRVTAAPSATVALTNKTIQCFTRITGFEDCATTVVLTDAQMKALPTTAITLVSAQGSSKRIQLVQASLVTNFTAGAYTNIGGTTPYIVLRLGTTEVSTFVANDAASAPVLTSLTTFLSAAAKHVTVVPWADVETSQGWGTIPSVTIVDANQALTIRAINDAAGNFTGGNSANTLTVYVSYWVIG